jgi:hypothetical protein
MLLGGHDVPWRFGPAGGADHVLVGVHVLVPEFALRDVAHGELPALRGLIEPRQQAPALLLPGDVQKKLEHSHAVTGEVALENP